MSRKLTYLHERRAAIERVQAYRKRWFYFVAGLSLLLGTPSSARFESVEAFAVSRVAVADCPFWLTRRC